MSKYVRLLLFVWFQASHEMQIARFTRRLSWFGIGLGFACCCFFLRLPKVFGNEWFSKLGHQFIDLYAELGPNTFSGWRFSRLVAWVWIGFLHHYTSFHRIDFTNQWRGFGKEQLNEGLRHRISIPRYKMFRVIFNILGWMAYSELWTLPLLLEYLGVALVLLQKLSMEILASFLHVSSAHSRPTLISNKLEEPVRCHLWISIGHEQ